SVSDNREPDSPSGGIVPQRIADRGQHPDALLWRQSPDVADIDRRVRALTFRRCEHLDVDAARHSKHRLAGAVDEQVGQLVIRGEDDPRGAVEKEADLQADPLRQATKRMSESTGQEADPQPPSGVLVEIGMPRSDHWYPMAQTEPDAELPDVTGPGEVDHVGL